MEVSVGVAVASAATSPNLGGVWQRPSFERTPPRHRVRPAPIRIVQHGRARPRGVVLNAAIGETVASGMADARPVGVSAVSALGRVDAVGHGQTQPRSPGVVASVGTAQATGTSPPPPVRRHSPPPSGWVSELDPIDSAWLTLQHDAREDDELLLLLGVFE